MPQFLTFALIAPIASFGSIAVGIRRPGWDRPARSAVLGLIGAALGVDREDDEAQAALAADYALALYCHSPGRLLTDFHTIQVPPTRRGRSFATRREELRAPDLGTVVTTRDYRTGAWHLAAVSLQRETVRWSLAEIAASMQAPRFVTYLGRRSCPLGLPLAPIVLEVGDAVSALLERHRTGPEGQIRTPDGRRLLRDVLADVPAAPIVTMDADPVEEKGDVRHRRTEMRRDQPLSRRRWQHGLRAEAILGGLS